MPAILERLVSQLQAKGMPKAKAYGIAVGSLQRAGDLKKGSTAATPKGFKRGLMTPAARAKNRAAGTSGHKAADYKYDAKTNRATLK